MKGSAQSVLTSLLLAMIVVALLAYSDWDTWFGSEELGTATEAQPDLIAHDVEQVHFNDGGELQYRLTAVEMLQFLDADHNRIIQPDILFYHQQAPAWKTTADEGSSDAAGDELHLHGNVTIVQQGQERAATMETATLTLFPKDSRAETEDKVTIREQGIYIEAIGLEADLNTNQLTLKSQVTSIYEPEKS